MELDETIDTDRALLKEISRAGGIGIERESGMKGELESMLEGMVRRGKIRRGRRAGQQMPMPNRGGFKGMGSIIVRQGGMTLDEMRESITQDPRWADRFENLGEFVQAIDTAIRIENGTMEAEGAAVYDLDGILTGALRVRPDYPWWSGFEADVELRADEDIARNSSGEPGAGGLESEGRDRELSQLGRKRVVYDRAGLKRYLGKGTEDYHPYPGETMGIEYPDGSFELHEDNGGKAPAGRAPIDITREGVEDNTDASSLTTFDLQEFDQGLFDLFNTEPDSPVDTLVTGEKQPRLPGDVGAVRDMEVPDKPVAELSDEFRLTPPPETQAKQTTLFQTKELTQEQATAFAERLKRATGPDLLELDLRMQNGDLWLETIAIRRGAVNAGLGSKVMEAVTALADQHGTRLVLSLAEKGHQPHEDSAKTSSRERLIKFYRRFGFVQNKGRYKDYRLSIYASMYRDPTAIVGAAVSPVTTETPAFKRWFGESKVVDEDGKPIVVYHGTTHDFEAFNPDRGNKENDFGTGYYFTSSTEDVSTNYGGEGPDLTSRIESQAERIEQELEDDPEITDARAEALARARAKLKGHGGAVVPAYLKLENPAVLGEGIHAPTMIEYFERWSIAEDDIDPEQLAELGEQTGLEGDELREEYAREHGEVVAEEGNGLAFAEALERLIDAHHDGDGAAIKGEVLEMLVEEGGPVELGKVIDRIRKSNGLVYVTDEDGNLSGNQIIRDALEAAGFDGIIDQTVFDKFGKGGRTAGFRAGMTGINPDTVHYIAFDPKQIKSAIGNRGTFDPDDARILHAPKRRGFIRFGPNPNDRQFSIDLLEKADLSTFLHESGHFFLIVLGDVVGKVAQIPEADRTVGQKDLIARYATILDWLGAKPGEELTEEQHEQWAQGFEAYLMEGKAPSLELAQAFAKFRAWLIGIYRSLTSLNVKLTPEVRRVMGRLLATEHAVQEADQAARMDPMFPVAIDVTQAMSVQEFEMYRRQVSDAGRQQAEALDAQLLAEVQREQEREWKTRRAEIEAEVEREVTSRPVYQAYFAITKGTTPDGQPLLEGMTPEGLKLDRAALVQEFGADRVKRLPRGLIARAGAGIGAAQIADMFGFSSTDAMLTALEDAGPMRQIIATDTDRRMQAEHGTLLLDGTLHEKAKAATANDSRESVVRAELRALGKLQRLARPFLEAGAQALREERQERDYERRWFEAETKLRIAIAEGKKQEEIDALRDRVRELETRTRGGAARIAAAIPPANTLRALAAQQVQQTKLRALTPNRFWAAAGRASRQATALAARQDFSGAIAAKQQELLNLALYRTASAARDEAQTQIRQANALTHKSARQRLGLAGKGFVEQVDGLLQRYGFMPVDPGVVQTRPTLAEWVADIEAEGMSIELPASVLADARGVPYQDLTVAELDAVSNALTQIVHLSRLQRKLLKAAAQVEFDEVRDAIVGSIYALNTRRDLPVEFDNPELRRRNVADWFASHAKIGALARILDGGLDGGAMWEHIIRPINAAADAESAQRQTAMTTMLGIRDKHYSPAEQRALSQKIEIPGVGPLTKEARLAVALNWGNADNRQRLTTDPERKWDRAHVEAILSTLDKRDWDFVQDVWDFLDQFWPEIAAKQERITGLAPNKVEALAVTTKFGEYRGGYYPLAYDARLSTRAGGNAVADDAKLATAAAYVRTTTKRGHTEERVRNVRDSIRLELGIIGQHVDQVIHDLTQHEMLIDVTRLLRDPQVRRAMRETRGDAYYDQFKTALSDIAIGGAKPGTTRLDRAATFMRTGTQLSLLGWNLWTAAQQPLGLFNGASRVGAKWVMRGMVRWMRDAASMERTTKWVNEVSPFMRSRSSNATQDLAELKTTLSGRGGWFDNLVRRVSADKLTQQTILDGYMWHIGLMQRVADMPTWLGAYEKAMAGEANEARAIALADQAVIDSQGSGLVKDLSNEQRGGPIAKLFLTFYSYGATVYSSSYAVAATTKWKSPASIATFLGHTSLLYIMPAMATAALRSARGDDDGDEGIADFARDVAVESLSAAMNGFVWVREFGGLATQLLGGEDGGVRGYEGPAGARIASLIYKLGAQAKQGEIDEGLLKALNAVGGVLFRYPAAQVQRTIDGWMALQEGETQNPLALVFGPPREASR